MADTPLKEAAIAYEVNRAAHKAIPIHALTDEQLMAADGMRVSESDYWKYFYEFSYVNYEWNNGILEAKPMSDPIKAEMYAWLFTLVLHYLHVHQLARFINLEIGFRMVVPDPDKPGTTKRVIRKPDLGIVRNDNPIPLHDHDKTYRGICDLCIESLSDSTKYEIERDIKEKKHEYAFAGVQEYYILDQMGTHMHFYEQIAPGVYEEMARGADPIIRSKVLPGFQFRVADLYRQPSLVDIAFDEVYSGFVLLEYQAAIQKINAAQARIKLEQQRAKRQQQRAEQERQRAEEQQLRAEQERQRAEEQQQRAEQERQRAEEQQQRAEQERQRAKQYADQLRALGIDVDDPDREL